MTWKNDSKRRVKTVKCPTIFPWLFSAFWTQQLLPFLVFSQNCSPRKIFTVWRIKKKNPIALFFNGCEPFLPAKNRLTFLETTKPANILKNSWVFNDFSKDLCANYSRFSIEAAHLPLKSSYGLGVLPPNFCGSFWNNDVWLSRNGFKCGNTGRRPMLKSCLYHVSERNEGKLAGHARAWEKVTRGRTYDSFR